MQRLSFDRDSKPFWVERDPRNVGTYDSKVGHNKPGSLRLSGTGDYNGWVSPRFAVHPNQTYKVVGWMKLENATGNSFIAAALFGAGSTKINTADLRGRIKPALDFAKKYNVPLWVGEFSAGAQQRPGGIPGRFRCGAYPALRGERHQLDLLELPRNHGPRRHGTGRPETRRQRRLSDQRAVAEGADGRLETESALSRPGPSGKHRFRTPAGSES